MPAVSRHLGGLQLPDERRASTSTASRKDTALWAVHTVAPSMNGHSTVSLDLTEKPRLRGAPLPPFFSGGDQGLGTMDVVSCTLRI